MITDPARLLNGYTFTLEPAPRCYVLGCGTPVVLSALHRRFGRVESCAGHHPERGALALTFGHPEPVVAPAPTTASPGDGARVPRRPVPPTLPPRPDALPLPAAATLF